jgi:fructokinase
MNRVVTVGETTYDIVFRNAQPTGAVVGGSVLNTSISLGRLGIPVTFVSRMGNDQVGQLSIDFLKSNAIDCDFITRYEGNSRLALAFLDEQNNASYEFYKADKAPSLIFPEINKDDIVVFGSTNAIKDEGRNSLLLFLNQVHDKNALSIYDPNIRECNPLELIEVRKKVKENFHLAKIVKGSTDDFQRLYSTSNANELFSVLSKYGVEVLIITAGSLPVQVCTASVSLSINVEAIEPVSTIGAGDNFTSGLIWGLLAKVQLIRQLSVITEAQWREILQPAIAFSIEECCSEANYISKDFADKFLVG